MPPLKSSDVGETPTGEFVPVAEMTIGAVGTGWQMTAGVVIVTFDDCIPVIVPGANVAVTFGELDPATAVIAATVNAALLDASRTFAGALPLLTIWKTPLDI